MQLHDEKGPKYVDLAHDVQHAQYLFIICT